jgi:hypothetical protein
MSTATPLDDALTVDPATITRWDPQAARMGATVAVYVPGDRVVLEERRGVGGAIGMVAMGAFLGLCGAAVTMAITGAGAGEGETLSTLGLASLIGGAAGAVLALRHRLRPVRRTIDLRERTLTLTNSGIDVRDDLRDAVAVLIERIHNVHEHDDGDTTDGYRCLVSLTLGGGHGGGQRVPVVHSRETFGDREAPYNAVVGFAAMLARELALPLRVTG